MKRSLTLFAWLLGLLAVPSLAAAATVSYSQAAGQLAQACGADIDKLCKGVRPTGDRFQSCLAENAGKVSPGCAQAYPVVFEEIAARSAAQAAMPHVCKWDAQRFCSNYRALGGGILRCLTMPGTAGKVSHKCDEAINAAGWR